MISIHALARRATEAYGNIAARPKYFNPRPRTEGDDKLDM